MRVIQYVQNVMLTHKNLELDECNYYFIQGSIKQWTMGKKLFYGMFYSIVLQQHVFDYCTFLILFNISPLHTLWLKFAEISIRSMQ